MAPGMPDMEFRPPVTLEGTSVRLVPLEPGHLEALVRAGDHPEIWTYVRHGDLRGSEAMSQNLDRILAAQGEGKVLSFVVLAKPGLEPVGMTGFVEIDRENRWVEIGGTWYTPARWRTPVNTECKRLLLGHAFDREGCHRVELKTDERNARSQAAIGRLGAVREGIRREHIRLPNGHWRTSVYFGIVLSEWPAVRARLDAMLARPYSGPAPP
jgi:RimJ/RimL family protein N-acetyltransferase